MRGEATGNRAPAPGNSPLSRSRWLLFVRCRLPVAGCLLSSCSTPPPVAVANDNRTPAGTLAGGTLRLRLTARMAAWHPAASDGPSIETAAFASGDRAPEVPSPLIRVPVGTTVHATVRNDLRDTLLVVGLGLARGGPDTLRVPPGREASIQASATLPGTYAYVGTTLTAGKPKVGGPGEQLFGAIVVDSATPAPDRIVVIKAWNGPPAAGEDEPYVMVLNGRTWPYTERVELAVGDTLRLRVINGADSEHPMHLHGFYYRVVAKGTWTADRPLDRDQQRMVATETLRARETMSLVWSPNRPGNWLFHCHDAFHIAGTQHFDLARQPRPTTPAVHSTPEHPFRDMAGLVMGITVTGDERGVAAPAVIGNRLRLEVRERARYHEHGEPAYYYALTSAAGMSSAEVAVPGPALTLTRGRRTAITIVNRLAVPTAVHWHGIELESFYDGVAGWSGSGRRLAPLIAPADSFVAIMTPPRSGTFIYHSHVDDAEQLGLGLVGALLVLEPSRRVDPELDHVWLFHLAGTDDSAKVILNGGRPLSPLRANLTHRIRVISISSGDNIDFGLLRDDSLVTWRAVAKDGADLPPTQATTRPATVYLGAGETADFEWRPLPGRYRLRVKTFNDFEVPLVVR